MVDSLNYSYDYGELSNSQKEAIVTLIGKRDKDRRDLSNWRPISLIKVDVKIGSKTIAKRLENVYQISYIIINVHVKGEPFLTQSERLKMSWNFQKGIILRGE